MNYCFQQNPVKEMPLTEVRNLYRSKHNIRVMWESHNPQKPIPFQIQSESTVNDE